jgi:hypothetical protein
MYWPSRPFAQASDQSTLDSRSHEPALTGMQISRLAVRLEGFAVVGGHSGPRSSGHTLQREVVVTGEEALLDSGEHRYKFLLDVPTSTAAKETNWHGRIRHSLVAIAETPALFFKPVRSHIIHRSLRSLPRAQLRSEGASTPTCCRACSRRPQCP